MNDAHFHLVVNHLPIIFPIVGALVLLSGIIFRTEVLKRMAYFIFMIGAVTTIFAMNSGEGAEEIVEHLPGDGEAFIHEHEEMAERFALLSYILGLCSALGLWFSWRKKSFANVFAIPLLIFACVVIYFGKSTGTSGGEIRHPEIRNGFKLEGNSSQDIDAEELD
ncbi:MAG: hypothetical protein V4638_08090 [Bacteroidota bacterium]